MCGRIHRYIFGNQFEQGRFEKIVLGLMRPEYPFDFLAQNRVSGACFLEKRRALMGGGVQQTVDQRIYFQIRSEVMPPRS